MIPDIKHREKYNLSGLALVATASLIDWQLTLTTPSRITADTAIDSLTHAIETFVSKKSNFVSDKLALTAIPLIAKTWERHSHLSVIQLPERLLCSEQRF